MAISNRVVELFAGVGGFHLAANQSGWEVIWANQWEPEKNVQHAADCYRHHFPDTPLSNQNIAEVINEIPEHDLLVGGFPCQDYSVAATNAKGVVGKKGVLWWEIARALELRRSPHVLLENVDRLLNSPVEQRGRDFAIMLATLDSLDYHVEWRVVNAADYGYPQRRRRVFIFAWRSDTEWGQKYSKCASSKEWIEEKGLFASVFGATVGRISVVELDIKQQSLFDIGGDVFEARDYLGDKVQSSGIPGDDARILEISKHWSRRKKSPFKNSGIMSDGKVFTAVSEALYEGPQKMLKDVLEEEIGDTSYYLDEKDMDRWLYLKNAKNAERESKDTGYAYTYSEGAVPFPDHLDRPSRTIVTGEGGRSPSRSKHVVRDKSGRLRRITPVESERLNGFPDAWTDATNMPENTRYFCMGNALVVPLVRDIMSGIYKNGRKS